MWAFIIITIAILIPLSMYMFSKHEYKILDEDVRRNTSGEHVALSDGFTHYELVGPDSGQVVVLVHGGWIPMWTWDEQINDLVKTGFKVLRYDQFGRGYSDRPNARYNHEFYRKQLYELIKALQLREPVDLVGLCFGAAISADFAAYHPEMVRKLIYIAPLHNMIKHKTRNGFAVRASRIPMLGKFLLRTATIPITNKRNRLFLEECNVKKVDYYDSLYEEQTVYRGYERAALSQLTNNVFEDNSAVYKKSSDAAPVLLIWGEKDNNILREHVEDVRKLLPGAEYCELKNIGHQSNWQAPVKFNQLVINYLCK